MDAIPKLLGRELTFHLQLFRPPNIDTLFSTEKLSNVHVRF